jgi:hypothetical protein
LVANVFGAKKVIVSRFRRKMQGGFPSLWHQSDKTLPTRTKMVFSGIDRNVEV